MHCAERQFEGKNLGIWIGTPIDDEYRYLARQRSSDFLSIRSLQLRLLPTEGSFELLASLFAGFALYLRS